MEHLTHHEAELQPLETERADTVTESELLQQRISELTVEKRGVEEKGVMREKRGMWRRGQKRC